MTYFIVVPPFGRCRSRAGGFDTGCRHSSLERMAPRQRRRVRRYRMTSVCRVPGPRRLVAVLAALVLLPAVPAAADPTPVQVESRINDTWSALEPVVEQYDRVHAQLVANQVRAAALQQRIVPLQM